MNENRTKSGLLYEVSEDGANVSLFPEDGPELILAANEVKEIKRAMKCRRDEIGEIRQHEIYSQFPKGCILVFCGYLCGQIIGYKEGDRDVCFDGLCECDRYGR